MPWSSLPALVERFLLFEDSVTLVALPAIQPTKLELFVSSFVNKLQIILLFFCTNLC